MSTTTFEGFSVTHAAILDGSTGAEAAGGNFYGIRSGAVSLDTNTWDNTGNDFVLSNWSWFNFATVTVTSGYIPFSLVALLTGQPIQSSGTGPNDYYSVPLWSEHSMNQPVKPMMIRVPSRDSNGVPRLMDIVLYRVQFQPITFDGPTYKDGMVSSYTGRATLSSFDELGNPLAERAIGRLINHAA